MVVRNIIRADETDIGPANVIIRRRRLGIPAESTDSLWIHGRENILERELGDKLQRAAWLTDGLRIAPCSVFAAQHKHRLLLECLGGGFAVGRPGNVVHPCPILAARA
jgi:hypothetical protein